MQQGEHDDFKGLDLFSLYGVIYKRTYVIMIIEVVDLVECGSVWFMLCNTMTTGSNPNHFLCC